MIYYLLQIFLLCCIIDSPQSTFFSYLYIYREKNVDLVQKTFLFLFRARVTYPKKYEIILISGAESESFDRKGPESIEYHVFIMNAGGKKLLCEL